MHATFTLDLEAPLCLADGNEYDIAMKVDVEYLPQVDGDLTAEGADIVGYANLDVALDVAGIGIALSMADEQKLFDSWLAVKGHKAKVVAAAVKHWERSGREEYLNDRDVRRQLSRAS